MSGAKAVVASDRSMLRDKLLAKDYSSNESEGPPGCFTSSRGRLHLREVVVSLFLDVCSCAQASDEFV